jgi:regulator of nucleoside diphosphate kinase
MILTNRDKELLRALVEIFRTGADDRAVAQLEAELDRATVVPGERVPPDIVTMNSRVVFEDQTGRRREIVLVYPPAADPARGRISVLEPIGTALLGLAVGEVVDWPGDDASPVRLRIVSVLFQPESIERATTFLRT